MSIKRCHGCNNPLVSLLVYPGVDGFDYCTRICQQRADREFEKTYQLRKESQEVMADKDLKQKKKKAEAEEAPKKKGKGKDKGDDKPKKSSGSEKHPFRQKESLIRRMFDLATDESGLKYDKIKAICEKEEADHRRIIRVLKMEEYGGYTWKAKEIEKEGVPYKLKIIFGKSKKSED